MERVQYKDQVHRREIAEDIHLESRNRASSAQQKPQLAVVPPSSAAMAPTEPPFVTAVQLAENSEVAQWRKEAADQAELVRNLQRQKKKKFQNCIWVWASNVVFRRCFHRFSVVFPPFSHHFSVVFFFR